MRGKERVRRRWGEVEGEAEEKEAEREMEKQRNSGDERQREPQDERGIVIGGKTKQRGSGGFIC